MTKKVALLKKSKESILSAIQIYNNPLILFKSESFIVLMIISWTYLMHAYYRGEKIDYRYFDQSNKGKRKLYDKTKRGTFKYWELERCLDNKLCPIDNITKENLKFLIGIRHEIEHQMIRNLDNHISAKFQSCILNYNSYIQKLFGDEHRIDQYITFSLQLASFDMEQTKTLMIDEHLPKIIQTYITDFEDKLSDDVYNSPQYAYRIMFTRKLVNKKGQADKIIEFVPYNSNPENITNGELEQVMIKETEKKKYKPSRIVKEIQKLYPKFTMTDHTKLWQSIDGRNPSKGYGTKIEETWFWYDTWIEYIKKHYKEPQDNYEENLFD